MAVFPCAVQYIPVPYLLLTPICPSSLSLSLLVTTKLFSTSVSLFLLCFIHLFVLSFRSHIQPVTWSIFLWLISMKIISSMSTYMAGSGKFCFLWLIFHYMEKEMATHSSIVARRIPWTEEPGVLQSMGSKELNMTEWLNNNWLNNNNFII